MTELRRVNLFTVAAEEATEQPDVSLCLPPPRACTRRGQAGRLGLRPPGSAESDFPYHYEYGCGGSSSSPAGRRSGTLAARTSSSSDLVGFPEGADRRAQGHEPDGRDRAHHDPLDEGRAGVAVYPDSDKVGLFTEDGTDDVMVDARARSTTGIASSEARAAGNGDLCLKWPGPIAETVARLRSLRRRDRGGPTSSARCPRAERRFPRPDQYRIRTDRAGLAAQSGANRRGSGPPRRRELCVGERTVLRVLGRARVVAGGGFVGAVVTPGRPSETAASSRTGARTARRRHPRTRGGASRWAVHGPIA